MGNTADQTFSESEQINGPLFEKARQGEAVGSEDWHLHLDRNGYLQDRYFIFLYSPIRDEIGADGGVLLTAWKLLPE